VVTKVTTLSLLELIFIMKTIGIRELKKHLSEALRDVQAGEIIEVTNRGQIIARVVPVKPQRHSPEAVRAALTDLDSLAAEIALYWPEGVSAADAVNDARGEH
jgi:prevent-host-death family protein